MRRDDDRMTIDVIDITIEGTRASVVCRVSRHMTATESVSAPGVPARPRAGAVVRRMTLLYERQADSWIRVK